MIKYALFLVISPLICSAEIAKGGPVQPATAAKPCASCKEMEMLEKRFNSFHVNVPSQNTTASDPVMMKPVLDFSQRLHEEAKGARSEKFYEEFESLVRLVAASLPFDIETQGAADIVQIIRSKDAEEKARSPKDTRPTKTRAIYERVLSQIQDKCRKKLLALTVSERECAVKFREAKKPEQYLEKECPLNNFDYAEWEAKRKC